MGSNVQRLVTAVIALVVVVGSAIAQDAPRLLAVDVSSPQATMRTFHQLTDAMEAVVIEFKAEPSAAKQAEIFKVALKLHSLFDLGAFNPAERRDAGRDAMTFLVDILRRIDVPPLETIPDAKAFPDTDKPASWTVPGTEITIARVLQGPKKGKFQFDAETLARAGEFYAVVRHLPLKVEARVPNWRQELLQLHGWMLPSGLVPALPELLKRPVLDTPAWKIVATLLLLMILTALLSLCIRFMSPATDSHNPASYLQRLLLPAATALAIVGARILIGYQIIAIGAFARAVEFVLAIAMYGAMAWASWLMIFTVIEWIIKSPKIPDRSLDANLLRLLGRIVGILSIACIAAYGAQQVGLPVFGVLAGLGVGGLAVALAAQSSIENLIGGLNLYADRPIRVGDFCEYAGIQGHVEHIGLRSTRIRGLDRTVTSVPNSILAKVHVTNLERRDQMLFRHVLDLRYETTTRQLRDVTKGILKYITEHPEVIDTVTKPRVHVIGFGPWSIRVEIYAYVNTTQFPHFLKVQEEFSVAIMEIVRKSGAEFAFPSQTTYLAKDGLATFDVSGRAETRIDEAGRPG